MQKKIASIIIIFIALMTFYNNNVYADVDRFTLSFLDNLLSIESWNTSQFLSSDEIKYKNNPDFRTPPECSFDVPAVTISDEIDIVFLDIKNDCKDVNTKMTFSSISFPESPRIDEENIVGTRSENASNNLILDGDKVVVDGVFRKSTFNDNWFLYINGSQLGESKYWLLTNFIVDGEEVPLHNYIGSNSKVCSAGKNAFDSNNAATYYRTEKYTIFDHKAESHVEIKSDKYDVETGIPTSEKITTCGWIDNADYYIKARETTYRGEVKDVEIKASVSYSWGKYETKNGTKTWKQQGSGTAKASENNYTITTKPKTFYDVPISNVAILTGGSVEATNEEYSIGKTQISPSNVMGESSSRINFIEKYFYVEKEYNLSDQISGYTSKAEAESAAQNRAKELIELKKRDINRFLVTALEGDQDSVDYEFYGFKVNKDGITGAPDVR